MLPRQYALSAYEESWIPFTRAEITADIVLCDKSDIAHTELAQAPAMLKVDHGVLDGKCDMTGAAGTAARSNLSGAMPAATLLLDEERSAKSSGLLQATAIRRTVPPEEDLPRKGKRRISRDPLD